MLIDNDLIHECMVDVNEGRFREEAEAVMTSLFKQTKFDQCYKFLQNSLADAADRFGRLKSAAKLLCATYDARTTIAHVGEWICNTQLYE